jgi:hypothetical protein
MNVFNECIHNRIVHRNC